MTITALEAQQTGTYKLSRGGLDHLPLYFIKILKSKDDRNEKKRYDTNNYFIVIYIHFSIFENGRN